MPTLPTLIELATGFVCPVNSTVSPQDNQTHKQMHISKPLICKPFLKSNLQNQSILKYKTKHTHTQTSKANFSRVEEFSIIFQE